MFEVNENIFYGMVGICKVSDIRKGKYLGNVSKEYYVLQPLQMKDTVIKIPTDSTAVVMRKPMSYDEAERLLCKLGEMEENWVDNPKERSKKYDEKIREGNPEEWVRIIRTYYVKKQEYRQKNRKLAISDGTIENNARRLFHDEISYVYHCEPENVEELIRTKIEGCKA